MDRRDRVELFEQIRREYEFGIGTIKGVSPEPFKMLTAGPTPHVRRLFTHI